MSDVRVPVVLTDHVRKLGACLRKGANLEGRDEIGPKYDAKINSPSAEDPDNPEMRSPGADYLAIDDPEIDKPDVETPDGNS